MITYKLKYKTESKSIIENYCRQYSSCLRFMFNRISDNSSVTEKELRSISSNINNIQLLDSWFIQCAIKEARQIYNSAQKKDNPTVIFGSKQNFFDRLQHKISKAEYQARRILPITSQGEKLQAGNRKYSFNSDLTVIFKPNASTHIKLTLIGIGNRKTDLSKLFTLANLKEATVTVKLDLEYIYISFEETLLGVTKYAKTKNRILGIDMNPNYIGWAIVDWYSEQEYKVVESGTYSVKTINDSLFVLRNRKTDDPDVHYFNNKRNTEILEISKNLIELARYYKVEVVSIEDLKFDNKKQDKKYSKYRGKRYNRLCQNYWNRNKFIDNLYKRCKLNCISLRKSPAKYSSIIGNLLYRKTELPDMELAAIELSRRAYEFKLQYIDKTKDIKKNIIFPELTDLFYSDIVQSLEEISLTGVKQISWKCITSRIKETSTNVRVSLDSIKSSWFRLYSNKSLVNKRNNMYE